MSAPTVAIFGATIESFALLPGVGLCQDTVGSRLHAWRYVSTRHLRTSVRLLIASYKSITFYIFFSLYSHYQQSVVLSVLAPINQYRLSAIYWQYDNS